jgi:hypothetical protein
MKPDRVLGSTSAAGAFRARSFDHPIVVGVMLAAGLGTSALDNLAGDTSRWLTSGSEQTSAGAPVAGATDSAEDAIAELRRLSGFTWDQLARLFGVTRRAVHFWASGKAMSATHEESLHRVLSAVRRIDRGSTAANRSLLLAVRDDGTIPFDLLRDGAYEDVVTLLGAGGLEPSGAMPPILSERARASRTPRAPTEIAEALQTPIHREHGQARAARAVRSRTNG